MRNGHIYLPLQRLALAVGLREKLLTLVQQDAAQLSVCSLPRRSTGLLPMFCLQAHNRVVYDQLLSVPWDQNKARTTSKQKPSTIVCYKQVQTSACDKIQIKERNLTLGISNATCIYARNRTTNRAKWNLLFEGVQEENRVVLLWLGCR